MDKRLKNFPYIFFVLLDIYDHPNTNGYEISARHKIAFTNVYTMTSLLVKEKLITKTQNAHRIDLLVTPHGEKIAEAFRKLLLLVDTESYTWVRGSRGVRIDKGN